MIKPKDIILDVQAMTNNEFLLAEIVQHFPYLDGKKSEIQQGLKYVVVIPTLRLEKISVFVNNNIPLVNLDKDIPTGSKVCFENLEMSLYLMNGNIGISAKADKIFFMDK